MDKKHNNILYRENFLFLILFSLMLSACVTRVDAIKRDKDIGLAKDEGYLLIAVDTNQQLEKIHIRGEKALILTADDLKSGTNYILTKVPAGHYKIRRVDFNSFYGYRLTGGIWGFDVEPNVISYVGTLDVVKNRWSLDARVELSNRSSEAMEFLEGNFPELSGIRSVKYCGPGEDDFFEIVKSVGDNTK
ncbi:hypothetical protein [Microbulbifer sp. SAOS-129_SWC]|uniref:hypothetical protein n=1 Tax=Microbulbifer sp. SAOS-129_SWC TaxID=3145235 RepID=UPI0032165F17